MSAKLEFGKPIPHELATSPEAREWRDKQRRAHPNTGKKRVHPTPADSGTGPDGKTCRDCQCCMAVENNSKRFYKCSKAWNGNGNDKTDIRLKWAACRHFEPKRDKWALLTEMYDAMACDRDRFPGGEQSIGLRLELFGHAVCFSVMDVEPPRQWVTWRQVYQTDDDAAAIAYLRANTKP